jgi:PASTA domain-containing protein
VSIDDLLKWVPDPPYSDVGIPLVPRVLHLSRGDASRALRDDGFHVVVSGRGPQVVRQAPGRGRVAPGSTPRHPFGGLVRIVLGP